MVTRGAESGQAYKCSASLRFTDFRCGMVLRGRVSHRHRGSRAHLAVSLCCHGRSICAALVSFLFTALGRGALGGWVEALVFPHCLSCTTKTTTSYRADWEPAATSGKCMAGVPGALWRLLAVLQGPSTHNPTLVPGETLILKIWPIFPLCMWKWGGSAPSGQARVSRPNWSQCANSHAAWQSLSSRAEKLRIFSKNIFFIFDHFF